MRLHSLHGIAPILVTLIGIAYAQRSPSVTSPIRDVVQSTLIAPGSAPFHLKATITEGREQSQSPYAQIEMFWMAPDKFRRTIQSQDFNQTLIVNGTGVFEEDSSDYFPLQLRTLLMAMVDPKPIIDAVRPGDRVLTKANGAVNDSGITCFGPNGNLCVKNKGGLREVVAASGHPVDFTNYESFEGKKVARVLTNAPRLGEELLTLRITQLEKLKPLDSSSFQVANETAPQQQFRFTTRSEMELRRAVLGTQEIIWPQPLDGGEKGAASFYVSIDRAGNVREVQPLYTVNERTNDSAVSQLMKWKYKPFTADGLPAQAEGVLTFTLNTRAWGPSSPLMDADARKLASNIVEPTVPAGAYPSGTVYTLWAAIDSEGKVIEVMAGDGPNELFGPCYDALRKWRFSPVMENGEPRPYRAQIAFHIQ
jgi:hypothetical protein